MAQEINTKLDKPVVAILKKGLKPGEKIEAMTDAGVPRNQVSLYLYRLEHVADPSLVISPASAAQIKKARDGGLRWERIAFRAGLVEKEGSLGAAVAKVKELYEQAGGDVTAYLGRGAPRQAGPRKSGTGTSGRRGSTAKKESTGTSGRRQQRGAQAKAAPAAKKAGRRGTRAGAKAADPK